MWRYSSKPAAPVPAQSSGTRNSCHIPHTHWPLLEKGSVGQKMLGSVLVGSNTSVIPTRIAARRPNLLNPTLGTALRATQNLLPSTSTQCYKFGVEVKSLSASRLGTTTTAPSRCRRFCQPVHRPLRDPTPVHSPARTDS